jgi:hypothetical protein
MSLYTHSGPLLHHKYVWVQPNACGTHDWLRAVWFGLTSYPGRALGCHVMLESGAVYRNVGLHQLADSIDADFVWTPAEAQTWDCYGYQFSVLEYPFLASMNCRVKLQNKMEHRGMYLFTIVPIGDAFSAAPEQSKEFYVMQLENGRFTAQPTNHVLIEDRSFCSKGADWPTFLQRQTEWFSAEDDL